MPKKITAEQRKIAVKGLSEGKTLRAIHAESGIPLSTIDCNKEIKAQSEIIKKEIQEEWNRDTADRIKNVAKGLLSSIESSVEVLTKEKIEAQSGAAIATTMGIMVDKMQLLTGGVTDNIQVVSGNRDEILRKLVDKSKRLGESKHSAKMPAELNITSGTETINQETPCKVNEKA
jgi:hypothetical protein